MMNTEEKKRRNKQVGESMQEKIRARRIGDKQN